MVTSSAVVGLVQHHLSHLFGRALVQADRHLWELLAQCGHRLGQYVAGLRVGGGNGQRACILQGVFITNAFEVAQLAQDHVNGLEDVQTRFGHAFEPLAVANKDVHPQLFFQLQNGLGNAGLRGVQRLGRFGQVEVAACRFVNKTELVQVHWGL